MLEKVKQFITDIKNHNRALFALIDQELKLRYRRTVMGYLWTILTPLLMMTVMALIFSNLFNQDLRLFTVFLFSGLIPWNYFSTTILSGGSSIIFNESIIKQIYLPKIIFPMSTSIAFLIDALLSFCVLFIIMLLIGIEISISLLFLPISFLFLFSFSFGISLVVSVANVFLRDLQHILTIGLQGLFFLSPILYETRNLSGIMGDVLSYNPIVPFIELFRFPLAYQSIPPINTIIIALTLSILSIIFGLFVFRQNQNKLVFRL